MTEFQITYLIGGVAGLLVGAAITLLVSRSRSKAALTTMARLEEMEKAALEEKLASVRQQLETVRTDLTAVEGRLDKRRDAMAELEAQKAALAQTATRIPVLEDALEKSRNGQEQLNAVNLALEKKLSELSTRLDAERRQAQEKIALLNDARERLTNEFKVLAERILEEKGKTFADHNKAQMDGLIGPLREQLGDFKKRVEDVYDKESRDRVALVNEINHLKNLNERIGKDALNLTNAGASGSRYQPDVIVRLPEGRDVIVDAKVSLKAYERYHASADETVRATAIKEHLASLRTHLKGLSEKHYEDLEGIRTLDFVLMFVPIEGAFFAAVEHDRSLFTEAFEKNVILVSPSTLLVTLRTIHNIWRYADQNENALEIARQAGGLYDKFIGFIEALEEVGRQLDRAKEAYRTARDRLTAGRGNLVRRAEQLKALGVKANKALPESYAAELEPEANGLNEEKD
ncbi:MAG: DNA recombination protein RmuC [Desulfosarcina sp.]|nr:DNA recombination protein RmuC [Desulfosarcina sp.]